jgi:hypothetical protein
MVIFNKNKIGFILLTLLCLSKIYSQENKQRKIGFTVGLAYNTQSQEKDQFFSVSNSYYNRFSPCLGLVYRDSLNKWLTLKVGLNYVQRGVRYDYKFDIPSYSLHYDQIYTCHYISFPIKLQFNIKKVFIGFGVEGSILLKGRSKVTVTEVTTGGTFNGGFNNWYGEKFYQIADAGYHFSLGYRPLKNLEIEFNMFHGLIPPPKFHVFAEPEQKYLYQQTFTLGINYFPNFKGIFKKRWLK